MALICDKIVTNFTFIFSFYSPSLRTSSTHQNPHCHFHCCRYCREEISNLRNFTRYFFCLFEAKSSQTHQYFQRVNFHLVRQYSLIFLWIFYHFHWKTPFQNSLTFTTNYISWSTESLHSFPTRNLLIDPRHQTYHLALAYFYCSLPSYHSKNNYASSMF